MKCLLEELYKYELFRFYILGGCFSELDNKIKLIFWIILIFNAIVLISGFSDNYIYNDDVNINFFWINFVGKDYQAAEHVRLFQPIGYRVLGVILDKFNVNLVIFSKISSFIIYIIFLIYCFLYAGKQGMRDKNFAMIFLLLIIINPALYAKIAGGHSRTWIPLLIMMTLYHVNASLPVHLLILAFSCFMNPIAFLVNSGIILQKRFFEKPINIRTNAMLLLGIVLLVFVLWFDQRETYEISGPMPDKRFEAFKDDYRNYGDRTRSIGYFFRELIRDEYKESYVFFYKIFGEDDVNNNILAYRILFSLRRVVFVFLFFAGLLAVLKAWMIRRELVYWFLSSFILYLFATILAFRLYSPSRYVFPISVLLPLWFIAALVASAYNIKKSYGYLILTVIFLLYGTGMSNEFFYSDYSREKGLIEYVAKNVPEEKLVWGHPKDLDAIPLLAKKRVAVSDEILSSSAWRTKLYELYKPFISVALKSVMLDKNDVRFFKDNNIEYLIVGKKWFSEGYLDGSEDYYFKPFEKPLREYLSGIPKENLMFFKKENLPANVKIEYEDKNYFFVSIDNSKAQDDSTSATITPIITDDYRRLWDEPSLRQLISENTDKYRKGDAFIEVMNSSGAPLSDCEISVVQTRHAFLFGCNLFVLGQLQTPELNQKYEDAFKALFNFASIPFYWAAIEPEKGILRYDDGVTTDVWRRPPPKRLVDWCAKNNIEPKGHPLLWHEHNPSWLPNNADELRSLYLKRFSGIADRFGGAVKIWDCVNEPTICVKKYPLYSDDRGYVAWAFKNAKKAMPKSTLLINETPDACYEYLGQNGEDTRYFKIIDSLLKQNTPIDAIGFQLHIMSDYGTTATLAGKLFTPQQIINVHRLYEKFGLPQYITEITIPTLGSDTGLARQTQAEMVENFYRLWFSLPNMAGITWWNLGDGTAISHEDKWNGGLLDKDLNPKPSYEVLNRLINQEWKTISEGKSDENGSFKFRGFYGSYHVKIKSQDKTCEYDINLTDKSDNKFPLTSK